MGNSQAKKEKNQVPPPPSVSLPKFGGYMNHSSTITPSTTTSTSTTFNRNLFNEPFSQTLLVKHPIANSYHNQIQRPKPPVFVEQPKRYPAISQAPSCNSYDIWKSCYYQHRLQEGHLDVYETRINDDGTRKYKENEQKRLEIQRQRQIAESRLYSEKESITPRPTFQSCFDLTPSFRSHKIHDEKHFKPKPERPELTQEMLMKVELASKPYPPEQCLVDIDGVQISRKDIRTLTGLNWLNDEIINAYLHLLVVRGSQSNHPKVYAFNTFFYPKLRDSGYASVKRWTRKVDIFSYDYLLVPVHLGNHWCLASIDLSRKVIAYYDSMGGRPNGCCDTLLEYLRFESNDKKKQELDDENYRLIDKYHEEGIPEQNNCSDCGVFACTYAEHLTRGAKLNFKQEHMPYFRKKIIYELLTKCILE